MTKMATREAYGKALVEFGKDPNIVVLDADLSKSTFTMLFQKEYPERHFNMGIAEANMMSVAAGMSTCGKTVFASTFAIFAAERALEQVRNSICYPNLNVKVCATHAGISVGEDGASHQCVEDLAIMRAIPNMRVISPCDAASTRLAIRAAIETPGPFYVRLGRLSVEGVYGEYGDETEFTIGKANTIREGKDITIIATGLMVQQSLGAAEILKEKGIDARVLDMHTIKPIDTDAVEKASKETGAIVTVEEHNILGGLGGAVAEAAAETTPCIMKRVGMRDTFGKSGKPEGLLKIYGLTAEDIAIEVEKTYARKMSLAK
ncbi:MAG: transketolase family protein [Clostridiaceae bacterium]|jgi:transketolase|nr:transketolase family protein [Oscillospiraceae bacterium]NLO63102.1 transketolase family protein [Clostridiaceae bacterium]